MLATSAPPRRSSRRGLAGAESCHRARPPVTWKLWTHEEAGAVAGCDGDDPNSPAAPWGAGAGLPRSDVPPTLRTATPCASVASPALRFSVHLLPAVHVS